MADSYVASASPVVLLVDDEKNILSSLRRVFRSAGYELLTADNGITALEMLASRSVDLVISDNRMPDMDGPTLLAAVEQRWPETMRIMLTAYDDTRSMIKAINEGRIYRYINKPWGDEELRRAAGEALDYQRLRRERDYLQKLTQSQNLALQDANATLEARVQERTVELERVLRLLTVAHDDLKRSYVTATEVFASLLNLRLPPSRQTNQEVAALVQAYAKAKELPQKLADDLTMAAALYNIGKLTWNDALIALPLERLDRDQRSEFGKYPLTGESLLMALEPAQEAALYIRHHQERWDGGGFPDGLAGDDIPLGARILKMAVDFVEMQKGMVLRRKLAYEDVITSMPTYAGRLYDPLICDEFVSIAMRLSEAADSVDETVVTVAVHALEPGMVLARDLHAPDGTLMLKTGFVVAERTITTLQRLEEFQGRAFQLQVLKPADEQESE